MTTHAVGEKEIQLMAYIPSSLLIRDNKDTKGISTLPLKVFFFFFFLLKRPLVREISYDDLSECKINN